MWHSIAVTTPLTQKAGNTASACYYLADAYSPAIHGAALKNLNRGADNATTVSAADGVTSVPATRTLTSATTDFVAAGITTDFELQIDDGTGDDGFYSIVGCRHQRAYS
jgi:hypothetical protein